MDLFIEYYLFKIIAMFLEHSNTKQNLSFP